jgi:PST family polysaccharide transporter
METKNQRQSFRSIFYATSLFGGVQSFQIIVSVVKAKILAVLLGTAGIGVLGLYSTALELINNITALGLPQSAVREVAEANGKQDQTRINYTVSIVRKLVLLTGFVGIGVTIFGSPAWSRISFGSFDYIIPFCFLSISALIDKLASGEKVVLQGLRNYKGLAKSAVIGSFFGLILSLPVYYFYGVKGIVPSLIINSIATYLANLFYSKKLQVIAVKTTFKESIVQGKGMIKMGIALSLTGILGTLVAYVIRTVIRSYGGLSDVGIYTAGYTLMFSYTGLIFAAMSTDFYPRLAAVNKDNDACCAISNQQAEIGIIILTPLLVLINTFIDYAINFLYTEEFLLARLFFLYGSVGMLFKMASWSISYLFVAKAEARLFAINETIANINVLILTLIGYMTLGIAGIGISTTVSFILYALQVWIISKKKYQFKFSNSFIKLFTTSIIILIISILISVCLNGSLRFVLGITLVTFTIVFALKELNSRIEVKDLIKNIKHERKQ